MERITFESDGYFAVCGKDCFEDQNENYCGPAIDRLAAYEDTGLTPDDVVELTGNHGMAISELAKVPQWIPVTERLPDEAPNSEGGSSSELVLVVVEDSLGSRFVADDITVHGGEWVNFPFPEWEVTHWMPLPEPPGKEGA